MARGESERSAALYEIIVDLLDQLGKPILYKPLTKVLIDSGLWATPWGKEPDQILYSLLHNRVKKDQQDGVIGRILFLGGGAFCTSLIEGVELLQEEIDAKVEKPALPAISENISPRNKYARPGDMPGDAEKRQQKAEAIQAEKKCGNCSHLTWSGPNITTHEVGGCSMYSQTRRACVFKNSAPCELWSMRSEAQRFNDNNYKARVIAEAKLVLTGKKSTL